MISKHSLQRMMINKKSSVIMKQQQNKELEQQELDDGNDDDDDRDFEYMVEKQEQDSRCFGSKMPRDPSPIGKYLSPFQKHYIGHTLAQGPGSYNVQDHLSVKQKLAKMTFSKKGAGTLASTAPRFDETIKFITPSAFQYAPKLDWPVAKPSKAPFLCNAIYEDKDKKIPGPGTYTIESKQCRRTKLMNNFGYPKLVDTIEMFCIGIPNDYCHKCKKLCDGDYWQKDHTLYLCHMCWMEERATKEIYTEKELKQFKKIRDCRYMHSHEGTTAKIHLLTPNQLKTKTRLEHYLDLYLKC